MITGTLPIVAIIGVATFLVFWLDYSIPSLSKVGASLLALIFGAIISNLGLVPASSPVYDAIAGPVTMLAIAWLLLAVNLSDLKLAGPKMVAAFGIAVFDQSRFSVNYTWCTDSNRYLLISFCF